jgi:hypothetical protein
MDRRRSIRIKLVEHAAAKADADVERRGKRRAARGMKVDHRRLESHGDIRTTVASRRFDQRCDAASFRSGRFVLVDEVRQRLDEADAVEAAPRRTVGSMMRRNRPPFMNH